MPLSEARRYRRVSVDLPAHITVNDTDAYEGVVVNMSPGGLALKVDAETVIGDAVVVRIKGLDIIEGTVARIYPDGFGVSFLLSKQRRTMLTEQLTLIANKSLSDGLEDRRGSLRHRRVGSRLVCRLPDGTALFVKLIDLSADGVSVDAPRRPDIGSAIHVGRTRGTVVRHTPRGFVVVLDYGAKNGAQPLLRAV